MQKKKESKTSRQKHKSETEVACASSSSLALSLCHCVQWHCSLLLYSWCGWIRFDFYLTETDSVWLSLCLVVCVCVCQDDCQYAWAGPLFAAVPTFTSDFCKWEFQFYDRLHNAHPLAIFIHSLIHLFMRSFIQTYSHLQGKVVAGIVKCCCLIRWSA